MLNSIQTKLLFILAGFILLFFIGLNFLINTEEEKINVLVKYRAEDQKKVFNAVFQSHEELYKVHMFDYTYWDEFVDFVQGADNNFANEYLVTAKESYDIDAVWVYTDSFKLVFHSNNLPVDLNNIVPVHNSAFREKISQNPFMIFYMKSELGILEIRTAPVHPTDDFKRLSKPRGYYITTRFYSDEYLNHIGESCESRIKIFPGASHIHDDKSTQGNISFDQDINDWQGNKIAVMEITSVMPFFSEIREMYNESIIQFITFSVLVFLLTSSLIEFWIRRPLSKIVRSFHTNDQNHIQTLLKKKNEFGTIAGLIKTRFDYQSALENEVNERKKAEAALTQLNDRLEELVADRTIKLQRTVIRLQQEVKLNEKTNKELLSAKEKAEEMNRLKTNFLANMSHELRTPMIGILGYTQMLITEADDPEIRSMAQVISDSGDRLLRTLNLILDLSRIESNKTELKIIEINVNSLLERLYRLFSNAVDKSKVNFLMQNNTKGVLLNSDEHLLEVVLNNLINNAIKFTESGEIKIETHLVFHEQKSFLQFCVSDTGIGISPEMTDIIFQEFRQASEGYSRTFEGSGLGLTVSKKFVELLGGQIMLESKPGAGSVFSLLIPLQTTAEQTFPISTADHSDVIAAQPSFTNQKILVVDDDEVARNIVPLMLKKLYFVRSVEDENSALAALAEDHYNLILLDIGLKHGSDGIRIFEKIRTLNGYNSVPIIAFTAFAMNTEVEFFLKVGFNGYLSKPFSRDSLIEVIQQHLS